MAIKLVMLKNMLQMKDWQNSNKKLKIMTKIAYSLRLALEGNLNNTIWLPDPENPQFGANILHVSLTVPELWLFEVARGAGKNR